MYSYVPSSISFAPADAPTAVADDDIARLADVFRLMGDPSRLRILVSCLGGPVCVGDIAMRLDLSPSLVSHHLRLLRAAHLVRAERQGKQVFYAAADQHVARVLADMIDHVAEPHVDEAGHTPGDVG